MCDHCSVLLSFSYSLHQFHYFAEPVGGEITIISESEMVGNVHKTAMEKVLAEQLKSSKFSKPDKKSPSNSCYYTSIPRVIKLKGVSGQDLTNMNLDKVFGLNLCSLYKIDQSFSFSFLLLLRITLYFTFNADTHIGDNSDEAIWWFRRFTSGRTTICLCSVSGISQQFQLFFAL